MNKVYNQYAYNNYYKLITVPANTIVEPGQHVSFSITTSANFDNDPTENKHKIPFMFGDPIALDDDLSDPSIVTCDKIPVNLFCKIYYAVLVPETKRIKFSFFAKNFTDESIKFTGIYVPIITTEYDFMY